MWCTGSSQLRIEIIWGTLESRRSVNQGIRTTVLNVFKMLYKHKELKPLVNTLKTCFDKENSYKVFIKLSWKFLVRIVKHLNKILKCFTFVQADTYYIIIVLFCLLKHKIYVSLYGSDFRIILESTVHTCITWTTYTCPIILAISSRLVSLPEISWKGRHLKARMFPFMACPS